MDPCTSSSIVTAPDGKGVILLGCEENPEVLYKMDENLTWTKMIQKLNYPRTSLISMLIPDELTVCNTE